MPTPTTAPSAPSAPTSPSPTAARLALLVLAGAGLLLPWWQYLPYFAHGGTAAFLGFWGAATANPVATGITLDVYLAAASVALWILHEGRVRRPWVWVLACFAVGLAAVLPLYLVTRDADGATVNR